VETFCLKNDKSLAREPKMNIASDVDSQCFGDPIEEPLMIIVGEGSGEESTVGNGEEKKKIFFFGQPGCLKHSPIKPALTGNHNNHNEAVQTSSKVEPTEAVTLQAGAIKLESAKDNSVNSDDDDDCGDNLLRKINEALGEKSENDSKESHPESTGKNWKLENCR
jgi:hypothetical protein